MACANSCKLCNRLIISTSVSVVTIDDTDTLVIDLPSSTYANGEKYCIVIAQTIPDTATINMPVAFSIGADTTTVYPFVRSNCSQITACGIRTRTRYSTVVSTTATGGVFKSLGGISSCPSNVLASLPVTTTTTETTTNSAVALKTPVVKATTTKTVSKKEAVTDA